MSMPLPEETARPDFAVVVRGYDRAQVDAYFGRALERIADAENRAAIAERERDQLTREMAELRATAMLLEERAGLPVPQSMSEFSDRIGQLMQNALEAAHDLQAQAEREAHERRTAIEEESGRRLEEARSEAERIVHRARESQRAVEDNISDLRAARADALAQLAVLHRQIADVVAMPEPDLHADDEVGAWDKGLGEGRDAGRLEPEAVTDGAAADGDPGIHTSATSTEHQKPHVEDVQEDESPAFETPAPTKVQAAVAPTGKQRAVTRDRDGAADAPTIVQPAVGKRPTR